MRVLVTGVAGFIGFHVAKALLARGDQVIGVDNLNAYYDVALKQARLNQIAGDKNFSFHRLNIADQAGMAFLAQAGVTHIVHLAAQAGVRYSQENPLVYAESNLMGHMVLLELARHSPGLKHFVYASSSSVYGGNTKTPFSVQDPVTRPLSLYAATKAADELMSYSYAHLFRIPMTGLRFFTVYGPWGRPDMAAYLFANQMRAGEPIRVFNHGQMKRDFTYIDDIVGGVLAALDRPPQDRGEEPPVALYNLGNSRAEDLLYFIGVLEQAMGIKAVFDFQPMQKGDVPETCADNQVTTRDLGFQPTTSIETGLPLFVAWHRAYHAG